MGFLTRSRSRSKSVRSSSRAQQEFQPPPLPQGSKPRTSRVGVPPPLSFSFPSSPPPPPHLVGQHPGAAATYYYAHAPGRSGMPTSPGTIPHAGQTVPLVPLSYPGHPATPQQMQYVTYVPYTGPLRSPGVLSPVAGSPPMAMRPSMSRSGSAKLQSPRKERERERERTRSMSRAMAYAAAASPPPPPMGVPPGIPISPISPVPVQHISVPHPQIQINTAPILPVRSPVTPSHNPVHPSPQKSAAAAASPNTPVYYPPITRFCPHCNARVPTEHHFQFCSSCQRPLSAYPQRPPSVVPDADGFAIPGIGGMPVVRQRDLGGARRPQQMQQMHMPPPTPTHKMSITEPSILSVSSAIGSPVYSSPASSPIGSLEGGGLGTKVWSASASGTTTPGAAPPASSSAAAGEGGESGPGSTHPAGREALVLPNGKPTRKLECLRDAIADFLFKQVPTNSGLIDMSRTYFLEWAWGRSNFLTLFNGDTTQRLYNALEYEYATVVTQHPSNAAVIERTPALSRKGLLQFLTHEILLDPQGTCARLKRLLGAYAGVIGPPPRELGVGEKWRVEEHMMLRAPHPLAIQKQRRAVQTMRGLGWEIPCPS